MQQDVPGSMMQRFSPHVCEKKRSNPAPLSHTTNGVASDPSCPCDLDLDPGEVEGERGVVAMETNEDFLIPYFQLQGLKARKGVGRRREVLDPEFEAPLFRFPPLRHALCLPDHRRSKVYLLTRREGLEVGDTVQFRVDVVSRCGAPRTVGGDEVRAWLDSADGQSTVPAKVHDLCNGSYVVETVLQWPGLTFPRVSLTYPREFFRAVVELHSTVHSMRWVTQECRNSQGAKETIPCLSSPPIPGYAKTCNFTSDNGGRPWFCGHPVTRGLNCSHARGLNNFPFIAPLPVSLLVKELVDNLDRCCPSGKQPDLRLIGNDIEIFTNQERGRRSLGEAPCWQQTARQSWEKPTPRGWLSKGQWRSTSCLLPPVTEERVRRCMQNRTLLLLGDSNQRELWFNIKDRIHCTNVSISAWHQPHVCQNKELNSTMIFASHARPFSAGSRSELTTALLPLPFALQRIQHHLSGKDHPMTIVLHFYMHLSTASVQVYRMMVQAARKSMEDFWQLHPQAQFVIRGPHVTFRGRNFHAHLGDTFAHWYERVWREELSDVMDRVWYLDAWDLTLASRNLDNHPTKEDVSRIVKILFGYMCE